jgi:hypothetical protein
MRLQKISWFWVFATLFALAWLVVAGAPFYYLITISM